MGITATKARSLCAEALAKLGTIRLAKGISPFTVLCRCEERMEALPSAWCIVGSAEIPTVLFSPQWVFAQNPVEQQWTELPYKLRGNKISSWGRNSPVSAPKEKPPYDYQLDKEPFKRSNLSGGFDEKTVSLVTRFRRV